MRPLFSAFFSVRVTAGWPSTSSKRLRAPLAGEDLVGHGWERERSERRTERRTKNEERRRTTTQTRYTDGSQFRVWFIFVLSSCLRSRDPTATRRACAHPRRPLALLPSGPDAVRDPWGLHKFRAAVRPAESAARSVSSPGTNVQSTAVRRRGCEASDVSTCASRAEAH